MISITGLHKRQQEIANEILSSEAKFHTVNASRQSGKTFLISRLGVYYALTMYDNIMIVSPSYDQVDIIFNNIIGMNGLKPFIKNIKNSTPKQITTTTGSTIKFRSAERPDKLRGSSNKVVILDEYAFTKEGLMHEIRPTTAAKNDSKIIISSTPNGKGNDFYQMYKLGLSDESNNYKTYEMSYLDNPYYDLKEIDDARESMPRLLFQQEYLAEFIDDGHVFSNLDKCSTVIEFKEPLEGKRYYAGIDWGNKVDRSVLTILDSNGDTVFIKALKDSKYEYIAAEYASDLKRYNYAYAYSEDNSIGEVANDYLEQTYSNFERFQTTSKSKPQLITELIISFNREDIGIPTRALYAELRQELDIFTFKKSTSSDNIKYEAPAGKHDDHVISLALANKCFKDNTRKTEIETFVPDYEDYGENMW